MSRMVTWATSRVSIFRGMVRSLIRPLAGMVVGAERQSQWEAVRKPLTTEVTGDTEAAGAGSKLHRSFAALRMTKLLRLTRESTSGRRGGGSRVRGRGIEFCRGFPGWEK